MHTETPVTIEDLVAKTELDAAQDRNTLIDAAEKKAAEQEAFKLTLLDEIKTTQSLDSLITIQKSLLSYVDDSLIQEAALTEISAALTAKIQFLQKPQ